MFSLEEISSFFTHSHSFSGSTFLLPETPTLIMDPSNHSMQPLDQEEEPSFLSLSLSALDLSDKVITDCSDLTVDNVNMLNASKQTVQESIQTEFEQLVDANYNRIFVSVMRTYFADKKEVCGRFCFCDLCLIDLHCLGPRC